MRKKLWKEKFAHKLLNFSVAIISLTNELPKNPAGFAIANQIVRSGTSIGANFIEAQDASSTKDFLHKLSISLKEGRETDYWLKVILESKLLNTNKVDFALKKCDEIIAILISSIKSTKKRL